MPIVHYCDFPGCGQWGAYGYGVRLREEIRGAWWCRRHRPAESAPQPAPKPAAPAAAPAGLFDFAQLPGRRRR